MEFGKAGAERVPPNQFDIIFSTTISFMRLALQPLLAPLGPQCVEEEPVFMHACLLASSRALRMA